MKTIQSISKKKFEKLIISANKKDLSNAKSKKIKDSMIDRLKLNNKKIVQIRSAIDKIIKFKDPVGKNFIFLEKTKWPNYKKNIHTNWCNRCNL